MKYTRDTYTKCIARIRLNTSQSSLKLLVCSSVPDNLSIGNSMELCMKVLLNCIRSCLHLFASTGGRFSGTKCPWNFYTLFNDKLRGFLHSATRKKIVSVYRKRKSRARILTSPKFYVSQLQMKTIHSFVNAKVSWFWKVSYAERKIY